jgi:uncharacterized protein YecT (DUF1311 family)
MSAPAGPAPRAKKCVHAALTAAYLVWSPFLTLHAAGSALEKVYQRALEDPDFKAADVELNAAYSRHMRTLPKEERDKLRQAERFWIRENQELTQQNTEQALELLKKRFLKRRDELVGLSLSQEQPASTTRPVEPTSPGSTPVPAPPAPPPPVQTPPASNPSPAGWNEKVAANLERVYQSALQDPEFESADSKLRAVFKQTVSALKPADREMLKPAQKNWVRENAVLVSAAPQNERAVLQSRVLERKAQLERMLETLRFESTAPPPSAAPVAAVAAPSQTPSLAAETKITLPPPVLTEPPAPPPPPVKDPTPPAETSDAPKGVVTAQSTNTTTRFFWALLGTWVFGLAFFHYRAFTRTQGRNAQNAQAPLNVRGLYLATGTGFLVALIPLFAVPSAFTAVTAVLFTIAGLGTAKVAAEEWARPSATSARKPLPTKQTPAPVENEPGAIVVHAQLQPTNPGRKRKGNRQKRRQR